MAIGIPASALVNIISSVLGVHDASTTAPLPIPTPDLPNPATTFANSTTVYANASTIAPQLLDLQNRLAALGY